MQTNLLLSIDDIYGAIISLVIAFFFLKSVSVYWIKSSVSFKLFLFGFFLRIIGVLATAYFNLYIVKSDSTIYFSAAKAISNAIAKLDFNESIKIFYTNFSDLPFKTKCFFSNSEAFNWVYNDNKTIIHLASVISYFTFDSYIAISFVFSIWGYIGTWLIYKTLYDKFKNASGLLFIFIIAYPSLFFWTTGLMKEPICIGSIGMLFYLLFNKSHSRKKTISFAFLGILSCFFLYKIKLYLFLSFIVSWMLTYVFYFTYKLYVAKKVLNATMFIVASVLCLFGIYFFIGNLLMSTFVEDATSNLISITKAQLDQGGSSYDIGQPELNPLSIIKYLFSSINVSLFRPFLWESSKPQLWFSAFEAMISLSMVIYLIFKKRVIRMFHFCISNPTLTFSLIFTLLISAIIGGISFNFGTLARYKVPILPFYFALLLIMYKNESINRKIK